MKQGRPLLALADLTVGEKIVIHTLKDANKKMSIHEIAQASGLKKLAGVREKLHVLCMAAYVTEHDAPGPAATYSASEVKL
jgi:hypothetical protein